MKVHVTMVSGKHIKIELKAQCETFLQQFNANSTANILIRIDNWDAILVKHHIESVMVSVN